MTAISKLISKLKTPRIDALVSARADIDSIRDRIVDLRSQRDTVENSPRDRASMERDLDAEIARRSATMLRLPSLIIADSDLHFAGEFNARFATDPFAVLAALFPERVKAVLLELVPLQGISNEERAARLAGLDRDIFAAELAEEVTIREVEAALGTDLARRRDANPAILLAPDEELT